MVKTGQLVSASRFAELTGLSRERLRTWERRHSFPQPRRVGLGPRRYALADVERVIAVRQAAEQGVPLPDAIAQALTGAGEGVSEAACAAFLERLPRFAALIAGPVELHFAYLNEAALGSPGSPRPGQALADYAPSSAGSELERALRAQLAGDGGPLEIDHESWPGAGRARLVLFRVPTAADEAPLVALLAVMTERERQLGEELEELRREHMRLSANASRLERWMATVARISEGFRHAGEQSLQPATDTLVRMLDAADAAIGTYMTGEIVVGRSSRRLLEPGMVTVAAHPGLGTILRGEKPDWLGAAGAAAFGASDDMHLLATPVIAAGEPLGLVLVLFEERVELHEYVSQALIAIAAGISYALLRERLVEGAEGNGGGAADGA